MHRPSQKCRASLSHLGGQPGKEIAASLANELITYFRCRQREALSTKCTYLFSQNNPGNMSRSNCFMPIKECITSVIFSSRLWKRNLTQTYTHIYTQLHTVKSNILTEDYILTATTTYYIFLCDCLHRIECSFFLFNDNQSSSGLNLSSYFCLMR